jgi:hypothetical protein
MIGARDHGPGRNRDGLWSRGPTRPRPIELRIQSVGQLFHTLDPLPFRERDLDASVEEYVVGWAGEMGGEQPITILIRLPAAEAKGEAAAHIGDGFRNYFAYRAEVLSWDLRILFRTGRVAMMVGLGALGVSVVLGRFSEAIMGAGYFARFLDEGLIILGWVANWRPIEIFLYDWWPIARRRRLYRRLACAGVEVVAESGDDNGAQAAAAGVATLAP